MDEHPISERRIKSDFNQKTRDTSAEKRAHLESRIAQMEKALPVTERPEYLAFADKTRSEELRKLEAQQIKERSERHDSAFRESFARIQQLDKNTRRPKGMPGLSREKMTEMANEAADKKVRVIEQDERYRTETEILEKLAGYHSQRQLRIHRNDARLEQERGKAKEPFNRAAQQGRDFGRE